MRDKVDKRYRSTKPSDDQQEDVSGKGSTDYHHVANGGHNSSICCDILRRAIEDKSDT